MSEYKFKIGSKSYEVNVESVESGIATVVVNGKTYSVAIEECARTGQESAPAPVAQGPVSSSVEQKPAASVSRIAQEPVSTISSPLPGVIINVCVKEGDSVKRGDRLAVLEAMKMENEILAEKDGTISKVFVSKGESVLEGARIVTIA